MTESFIVYIVERGTNNMVPAIAKSAKRTDMIGLKGKGWNFNWSKLFKDGYIVYKIILDDELHGLIAFYDNTDQGVVYVVDVESAPRNIGGKKGKYRVGNTLFAIAAKYSFDCGEEGYVFFEAKTDLIEHYETFLSARLTMPPKGMGIFPRQAAKLVNNFIGGIS